MFDEFNAHRLAGHPKTVRIREDVLLNAVPDFYAERVFGRSRVALLTAELATFDDRDAQERAAARGKLQRRIEDLARKQDNILRQAQDGDPADPFTQGLRRSYNDLDSRRAAVLAKVEDLDVADDAEPDRPGPDSLALLDALPKLQLTLGQAPEALQRRLYEITQLAVHVNHENQEVQMVIKIPATDLDQVADLAEAAAMPAPRTASTRGPRRVDAVRAPGGIRTHTVGGLSTVSLPLEYRGRPVGERGSRVLQAATGPLDVQVGLPLRL